MLVAAVAPLVTIVWVSFWRLDGLNLVRTIDTEAWRSVLRDPTFYRLAWSTLQTVVIVLVLVGVLGLTAGYFLARFVTNRKLQALLLDAGDPPLLDELSDPDHYLAAPLREQRGDQLPAGQSWAAPDGVVPVQPAGHDLRHDVALCRLRHRSGFLGAVADRPGGYRRLALPGRQCLDHLSHRRAPAGTGRTRGRALLRLDLPVRRLRHGSAHRRRHQSRCSPMRSRSTPDRVSGRWPPRWQWCSSGSPSLVLAIFMRVYDLRKEL